MKMCFVLASVSVSITQISIILTGFISVAIIAKILLISLRMWAD